jgi:hypothetical protein
VKTVKYARKPFYVQAVRITKENFDEISNWTGGEAMKDDKDRDYIKVLVSGQASERQSRAYVGDWVLESNPGSFKIYSDRSFKACFEEVVAPSDEALRKLQAAVNGSKRQ